MIETGVFGLVGVIVGGVVTGAVQLVLERRRETVTRRSAMRLLASDLYVAQALIKPVVEVSAWGSEQISMPLEAWNEYRGVISAALDGDSTTWKYTEGAVLGMRRLNDIRNQAIAGGRQFTPEELGDFRRIGEWVDKTIEKLKPYVE